MSQNIAARGDTGLFLAQGPPFLSTPQPPKSLDSSKNCKVLAFSNSGQSLAWSDGSAVHVMSEIGGAQSKTTFDAARVQFLVWSPKDTFLASWEVYAVRNGKEEPNMKIWNVSSGQLVKGFVVRKNDGWQPRWSEDESLCVVRGVNNEVQYYKDSNFETVEKRLSIAKMDSFSVSPRGSHVVAFIPGQKGAPGFAKLFAYPNFHPEKDVLASKSFMLADKMEAKWSPDSKAVLLLMQAEVDKTGSSYYGKTQLHYMDITGETSMVSLGKEGPIYSVSWCPKLIGNSKSYEFCAVYGFMPAKATLYNKKCDKVFDFGTGARNLALFNNQGTLLMLGGFGNLRGNIEMWDVANRKTVSKFEAPDSTEVQWSPDGQYILTSTCAPRLRMSNGYKVWHYSSTLFHETMYKDSTATSNGEELWEAKWQPIPSMSSKQFNIVNKPVSGGVKPVQPQASKQAYVPPAARGRINKDGEYKKTNPLHQDDELPENLKKSADGSNLSKSAAKNKKRREAAKKKKEEDEAAAANNSAASNTAKPMISEVKNDQPAKNNLKLTGDPEKDKQIKKLNDKLKQITKLKAQVKEGKKLETNQLEKIKKESELMEEMKKLQI